MAPKQGRVEHLHYVAVDPETGKIDGVLCYDRRSQTCTVLMWNKRSIQKLMQAAEALSCPTVCIMESDNVKISELLTLGWEPTNETVLMKKV